MDKPHPNVQRVMDGMKAFNAGDLDGVRSIYREDMVYRVAGRSPLAGEYRGIKAYADVVQRVREETEGEIRFETHVLLADSRTVMLLARTRGRRLGRTLDSESIYIFRFDQDGLCYEGRTIPVDQYAYDAFWS